MKKYVKILLGIFFVVIIILVFKTTSNFNENSSFNNCEETSFIKYGLETFERDYLDEFVVDWYVDEKEVAPFYWDKLCRDLLDVRLNETLSKSENLWLDTRSWFLEDDIELGCNYNVYWGEEGDFYGRSIESGKVFFSTEELLLAQEKRPLRYNESLISVKWIEGFDGEFETRLENNNPDYFVVLNLKLNETTLVC